MTPKHYRLLRLLETAAGPMNSDALAERLGMSSRSVKKYVSEINAAHPGSILSSSFGYALCAKSWSKKASAVPQTQEERIGCLVRRILLGAEDCVSLTGFASEVHISPESVKADAAKLQARLLSGTLRIRVSLEQIGIDGSEADKRNILCESVTDYLSYARFSVKGLEDLFPSFPVARLWESLMEVTCAQGMIVNDILWPNFVRDVLVAVTRIRLGHALPTAQEKQDGWQEHPAASAAAACVERVCGASLDGEERRAFQCIAFSYWLPQDFADMTYDYLYGRLPKESQRVLDEFFEWARRDMPFLALAHAFRVRLSLNLHNLLQRKAIGRKTLNPQIADMKLASPFAFCCAIHCIEELARITGMSFTESDAAYLSVHIGLSLQGQKHTEQEKVSCGLLITPFFGYERDLKAKLLSHFSHDIKIAEDVQSEHDLHLLHGVQLIISTVPLPAGFPVDWVTTNPLLSRQKIWEIACHIRSKKQENRRRILRQFLLEHGYFDDAPGKNSERHSDWTVVHRMAICLITATSEPKSRLIFHAARGKERIKGERVDIFCQVMLCPQEWEIVSYSLTIIAECLYSAQKIPWGKVTGMEELIAELEKAEPLADLLC